MKKRLAIFVQGEGLHKIGEVSPALGVEGAKALLMEPPKPPAVDSDKFVRGNIRAQREELWSIGEDRARWTILVKSKPGDSIVIHDRGGAESVTFHHVLERGKRYVFLAANSRGELINYELECICLGRRDHATPT